VDYLTDIPAWLLDLTVDRLIHTSPSWSSS
jgi:hypothetical protein